MPGEAGTQLPIVLDVEKRDRFELLSAYLDGEATADEKRHVEVLLASDPAMQCLHTRLMKLRHSFRNLPVPPSEQPVEQTVEQVFARIERKPRRVIAWGGMAIAAVFVGALVGILPRHEFMPSMARAPQSHETVPSPGLMIALDRPVIEIPKAAVSTPEPVPEHSRDSIQ
ncbi:MAG: transcriptional regulator [Leptolyngbyaceae cyanobacterium CRU_2_3]|nr:transcriptional regulator [Leptolyngbyaceae cyanobacterium CRU_2_3]